MKYDACWFIEHNQYWHGVRTPETEDDGWAMPRKTFRPHPVIDRPARDLQCPWDVNRVKAWFMRGDHIKWDRSDDASD